MLPSTVPKSQLNLLLPEEVVRHDPLLSFPVPEELRDSDEEDAPARGLFCGLILTVGCSQDWANLLNVLVKVLQPRLTARTRGKNSASSQPQEQGPKEKHPNNLTS